MARYDLSIRTLSLNSAEAALEIRSTSADRPRLLELDLAAVAAGASVFGLGIPAAIGITPTAPVALLNEDSADAPASVTLAVAWLTKPTLPNAFYRRFGIVAQIGAAVLYVFPRGLAIASSSSLVLWNITTTVLLDVSVTIGE